MEKIKAENEAKKIIGEVVNMIANRKYEEIPKVALLGALNVDLIKELVEGYLELNELPYIDCFGTKCSFHRQGYEQLSIIHYNNGSGFHVDYDLTTNEQLNDLTLQMEFLYDGHSLIAKLEDLHVM